MIHPIARRRLGKGKEDLHEICLEEEIEDYFMEE